MYSPCRSALLVASVLLAGAAEGRSLRVCADPDNLPFSNQRGEGFENRLAELMAKELGARVEYTWWPQKGHYVRNTLDAGTCDVIMGVPVGFDEAAVTEPYYRSTYVIVSRREKISSLLDPRLEKMRIEVQLTGEDYAPPAIVLGRRGLAGNLVGENHRPAEIVNAVARGTVDAAILWGPFAGYFAREAGAPVEIAAVTPAMYMGVPFTYEIGMAVRKNDGDLRGELDRAIEKNRAAIKALLAEYGVPLVGPQGGEQACARLPQSPSRFWR